MQGPKKFIQLRTSKMKRDKKIRKKNCVYIFAWHYKNKLKTSACKYKDVNDDFDSNDNNDTVCVRIKRMWSSVCITKISFKKK